MIGNIIQNGFCVLVLVWCMWSDRRAARREREAYELGSRVTDAQLQTLVTFIGDGFRLMNENSNTRYEGIIEVTGRLVRANNEAAAKRNSETFELIRKIEVSLLSAMKGLHYHD